MDSVVTTMPSVAWVAHDATSFGLPSTDTRQIRQLPTVGSFGYQHNVGTSTFSERAASRMVAPSGAETTTPSIVSFGIQPRGLAASAAAQSIMTGGAVRRPVTWCPNPPATRWLV